MNSSSKINIKNCLRTTFFCDMINMKILDPNKIEIDEKSHKNIPMYYIGYATSNSAEAL